MSALGSPGISPDLYENSSEVSLFDLDTKDSGFCEDDREKLLSSPLCLDDNEATILCFSPHEDVVDVTPYKKPFLANKKRLFASPLDSPSVEAASTLKRLKIFDLDCSQTADSFEELTVTLDFSDKILAESSDDEVCTVPSVDFQEDEVISVYSVEVQRGLVKQAVEKSKDGDLIGDFSKNYGLPLIAGSHPDLKSISVETMKDVLEGKFKNIFSSVMIIDSRYPYEYQGGHIRGAINIYTKEDCLKLLYKPANSKDERHILIFHCEFSKERGPNMLRAMRKEDRTKNMMNYPTLNFPEIYVLEGGYKKFYQTFPQYCDPMEYKQMLHPEHADEMRFFRKRSKTADSILKTNRKNAPRPRTNGAVRKFLSNDF